jgi:integrase
VNEKSIDRRKYNDKDMTMKSKKLNIAQTFEEKGFGSIYTTSGSKYLYISFYYFKKRLRFPIDRIDTPINREELRVFLNNVGKKIEDGTFCFAKTFYWLDQETKDYFSALEGREVKPEPEHVTFGEYAEKWIEKKIPKFASVTKRRDYREALTSRILPYFEDMPFASITATVIEDFIDNMERTVRAKTPGRAKGARNNTPLSVKRIKSIMTPMSKIWIAACNDYNWILPYPFMGLKAKYKEMTDQSLQEQERLVILQGDEEEEPSRREVILCSEWQKLLLFVDPHYHVVMDLLLLGMIGSELEALQKKHVTGEAVEVRWAVVRDRKKDEVHLKLKPKNWYRKRKLPITHRLRGLLDQAMQASCGAEIVEFSNGISLPANHFVLTMKDGSPFNYNSFRKTVWDPAMKKAGIAEKVPYASRHTLVQWALLIGVTKTRLVELMGHCNKNMIDRVYGQYRQGLVDEREAILDYLGEDFLAFEELKIGFPDRHRRAVEELQRPTPIDLTVNSGVAA